MTSCYETAREKLLVADVLFGDGIDHVSVQTNHFDLKGFPRFLVAVEVLDKIKGFRRQSHHRVALAEDSLEMSSAHQLEVVLHHLEVAEQGRDVVSQVLGDVQASVREGFDEVRGFDFEGGGSGFGDFHDRDSFGGFGGHVNRFNPIILDWSIPIRCVQIVPIST